MKNAGTSCIRLLKNKEPFDRDSIPWDRRYKDYKEGLRGRILVGSPAAIAKFFSVDTMPLNLVFPIVAFDEAMDPCYIKALSNPQTPFWGRIVLPVFICSQSNFCMPANVRIRPWLYACYETLATTIGVLCVSRINANVPKLHDYLFTVQWKDLRAQLHGHIVDQTKGRHSVRVITSSIPDILSKIIHGDMKERRACVVVFDEASKGQMKATEAKLVELGKYRNGTTEHRVQVARAINGYGVKRFKALCEGNLQTLFIPLEIRKGVKYYEFDRPTSFFCVLSELNFDSFLEAHAMLCDGVKDLRCLTIFTGTTGDASMFGPEVHAAIQPPREEPK
eukprot:gene19567-26250_t